MGDSKPGLLDPWAEPEKPAEQPSSRQQYENPDLAPHGLVQFSGQSYVLNIHVLLTGPNGPSAKIAEAVLGAAIRILLDQFPASRSILQGQRLFLKPPQDASVPLVLGDFTLYASAGSREPELAHRMALDRIAMALTEAKQRVPGVRQLLGKFKIDITLKVR